MVNSNISLIKKSIKEYHELQHKLEMCKKSDHELAKILEVEDIIEDMIAEYEYAIQKKKDFYVEYLEYLINNNLIKN